MNSENQLSEQITNSRSTCATVLSTPSSHSLSAPNAITEQIVDKNDLNAYSAYLRSKLLQQKREKEMVKTNGKEEKSIVTKSLVEETSSVNSLSATDGDSEQPVDKNDLNAYSAYLRSITKTKKRKREKEMQENQVKVELPLKAETILVAEQVKVEEPIILNEESIDIIPLTS